MRHICSILHSLTINEVSKRTSHVKVVGKAQATKSNLHHFWYKGLAMGLSYISEVLWRSLLACIFYERNKITKILCEVSNNN